MIFPKKQFSSQASVPKDKIWSVYKSFRLQALLAVFLGYAGYYIVRNSFTLSTPYLKDFLGLTVSEIGILSSCMLVSYGIFRGVMGSFADKFNPKYFVAFGLGMSCLVNVFMGFSSALWMFIGLVLINGVVQGMGAAPAYITMANWYPRLQRGRVAAVWNISHNIGGGIVAPIVALGIILLGTSNWQFASYLFPASAAFLIVILVLVLGKDIPEKEGLPPLNELYPTELSAKEQVKDNLRPPEEMNVLQIFWHYVLPNKNIWYIAIMDAFVYVVRFGLFAWLPIYLLHEKGFSKTEMGLAFLFFEWAAIPSTLLAGYLSDKLFKGLRMPPAIIATSFIAIALFVYWQSSSIILIMISTAVIGCLVYIPQFLGNVQSMEIVPPFAIGTGSALRSFMAYLVGAAGGTATIGVVADKYGWDAGIMVIFVAIAGALIFASLAHFEVQKLYKKQADILTHKNSH